MMTNKVNKEEAVVFTSRLENRIVARSRDGSFSRDSIIFR
jgi:hypothetical protein